MQARLVRLAPAGRDGRRLGRLGSQRKLRLPNAGCRSDDRNQSIFESPELHTLAHQQLCRRTFFFTPFVFQNFFAYEITAGEKAGETGLFAYKLF
jgi:hypothetical protein